MLPRSAKITFASHTYKYTHNYTVNRERFAGLNFCVFHNFQGYRRSFSMNIYKLYIMALFKCFKCKAPQTFSHEKLHWVDLQKFSPVNVSPFMVVLH